MSDGKSVNIPFTGDASGLIGSINASIEAMSKIESQSKSFAGSMAGTAIKQLAPIAAAIAGAFAAKEALKDFAASDLPGAKGFKSAIKATEKSLKTLSEVIGEFLAPAAEFVAKKISQIADALAPIIRIISAFKSSAGEFLLKLASNFAEAFSVIMPTATAAVNFIKNLFTGPSRDWAKDVEWFRGRWNHIWGQILEYTTPIMIAAAGVVEASLDVMREAAQAAMEAITGVVNQVRADADEAGVSIASLASVIQDGLVIALLSVEFAIRNWRDVLDIAIAGFYTGIEMIKTGFVALGPQLLENMEVLGENLGTIFVHLFDELLPNLAVVGENMGEVFKNVGIGIKKIFLILGFDIGEIFRATTATLFDNLCAFVVRVAGAFEKLALQIAAAIDPTGASGLVKTTVEFGESLMGGPLANKVFPWSKPDFSNLIPIQGISVPKSTFKSLPGVAPLPDDALKSLPGFELPEPSDAQKKAKAILDGFTGSFKQGLETFLGIRMVDISEASKKFMAAVLNGLPNVNATPGDRVGKGVSNKSAAAAVFGTSAAYSAIVAATSGITDKQLAEAQKHSRLLGDIKNNTGRKAPKANIH